MKKLKLIFLLTMSILTGYCEAQEKSIGNSLVNEDMLIRISEIEIHSNHLEEYIKILKEEAEASMRLEPGVISIYPMFKKDNPSEIRILEIYKDRMSYESHLQTSHFKYYKTSTIEMVKSLKLIDMEPMDVETMKKIFTKLNG